MEIDTSEDLYTLKRAVEEAPSDRRELPSYLIGSVFPLLDMDSWIEHIIGSLPSGKVTTFGTVASALGTLKAARSVGGWAAENGGISDGPVFSDGRMPKGSLRSFRDLPGIERRGDDWFVPEDRLIREIILKDPPFSSLKALQDHCNGLISNRTSPVRNLAGVDISSGGKKHICAVCTMDLEGSGTGNTGVSGEPGIPYVSGFLFYREAPLVIPALIRGEEKGLIDRDGTLIVMDGNGYLHPSRMGIACQMGAVSGMMTCGVAKKLQTGTVGKWRSFSKDEYLADVSEGGEIIGYASRHAQGAPVYLSKGNRTSLEEITSILVRIKNGRLPEPTRRAHITANRWRRSESPSGDLEVLPLPLHEGIDG